MHSPLGLQPSCFMAGRRRENQPRQSEPVQKSSSSIHASRLWPKIRYMAPRPTGRRSRAGNEHDPCVAGREALRSSFVRDWTNGAFLMRQDDHQLLTGRDSRHAATRKLLRLRPAERGPGELSRRSGLRPGDVVPALFGAMRSRWPTESCRMPAGFEQLTGLAAQSCAGTAEELTSVPRVTYAGRRACSPPHALLLLQLGSTRTPQRRHSDRPGRLHVLHAHRTVRSARQQRALREHPDPTDHGRPLPETTRVQTPSYHRAAARLAGPLGRDQASHAYRAILNQQPYPVKAKSVSTETAARQPRSNSL